MKLWQNLLYLLLSVIVLACSGDEDDEFSLSGTNTSVAALAGNWNATSAIFATPLGQVMEVDVVAEGGTATLNIQANGRFNLTITQQGQSPEVTTGDLRFDEDLLVIFFDDDPGEWEYFGITHNEPILNIDDRNATAEFDFDGDGNLEPANIYLVLERA